MQKYLDKLVLIVEKRLIEKTVPVWLDYEHFVEYPNIFVQLRGHDLEEQIYGSIIGEKIANKIIDHFKIQRSSEVFIPFELQKKFENLTKIFIELFDENFEKNVFNTNFNWFVKFLNTSGNEISDLKFSKA